MKLINTIEFEPGRFQSQEYDINFDWTDEAAYKYWKKCLADSNLQHLEPIRKRSWLVNTDTINTAELCMLIDKELEDVDIANYDDEVSCIDGGIVLLDEDNILLETQCCGDLANIREWQSMINNVTETWTMLWIGHPWVYYKNDGDEILFSDYTEGNANENTATKFSLSKDWLVQELGSLQIAQCSLMDKVRNILVGKNVEHSAEIAQLMINGRPMLNEE